MESDAQIRRYMNSFLQDCKYRCTLTDNGRIGLSILLEKPQDLIVLDMDLKDCDSLLLLKKMREMTESPIIATSFKKEKTEAKLLNAFDGGADDYIIKPFSEGEFLARLKVRLRRARPFFTVKTEVNIFKMDYLTVDFDKVRIFVHDQAVHFTPTEYRLLSFLIKYKGKALTYEQITWELWGKNFEANASKIRVYIMSIRRKICDNAQNPRFIFSISGYGYHFAED